MQRGQRRLVRDGDQVHDGCVFFIAFRFRVAQRVKGKLPRHRRGLDAVSDHLAVSRQVFRGYRAGPGRGLRVGHASHVGHAFLSEHGDVTDSRGDDVSVVERHEVRVVLAEALSSKGDIGVDAEVLAGPRPLEVFRNLGHLEIRTLRYSVALAVALLGGRHRAVAARRGVEAAQERA